MTWKLQPLLDLRRRDEQEAHGELGRTLSRWHAGQVEALALRRQATDAAAQALRAGAGVDVARWAARLRLEAERLHGRAIEAEARGRIAAAAVEARRATLLQASLRREVVARLEAAWRRGRALEAARRSEAALDDRPWRRPPG